MTTNDLLFGALPYAAAMSGAKLVLPGADYSGAAIYQLLEQEKVTTGAGDFSTAGSGERQVHQDQVGPIVPVQPSRGHVRGGIRRDRNRRLKPAARTTLRQVEFVSARAHQ